MMVVFRGSHPSFGTVKILGHRTSRVFSDRKSDLVDTFYGSGGVGEGSTILNSQLNKYKDNIL